MLTWTKWKAKKKFQIYPLLSQWFSCADCVSFCATSCVPQIRVKWTPNKRLTKQTSCAPQIRVKCAPNKRLTKQICAFVSSTAIGCPKTAFFENHLHITLFTYYVISNDFAAYIYALTQARSATGVRLLERIVLKWANIWDFVRRVDWYYFHSSVLFEQ